MLRRRRDGSGPHRFADDALDRLVHYAWPGNVESEDLVERLIVTVDEDEITVAHLGAFPGAPVGEPIPAPRTTRN